jgi:formate dehydrogenase alpha subunit
MRVLTDTEALRAYRRDLGELMLSESRPAGPVAAILSAWGADGSRYGAPALRGVQDRSHAYLRFELDRCILCRRCVRACDEIQGQFVYAIEGRGAESRLAWGAGSFAASACVSCGACVTSCPTGAIMDSDREVAGDVTSTVLTTCGYCGVGCQLEVHLQTGGVSWIDGAERAPNRRHLCVKGRYAHAFQKHRDRLTAPLIRRGGVLVHASWDEAIALVAAKLLEHRGKVAGLSSSRSTNEENYLLQKWMRAGLGTNNVDCCARVCHAPSAAGLRVAFGTGAATNSFDDIERADIILVAGANVTVAHPVVGARIKEAVLRGTKLVVIDPRRTELAAMADVHLQVRPGANVPLFNAMASVLVEEGLLDASFIEDRAEGWEEFQSFILRETPERWEHVTGVPGALVREAARLYGGARSPIILNGLGVTEHYQGSEAVMLLANLAILKGAVGREGVGVNPLRGQNNVQGAADMGCQPDLLTGYAAVDDDLARARFEAIWGRKVPSEPGLRIPEIYEAAVRGDVRALFILGEDVAQTDPDASSTKRALEALDFLVVQEIFLSETARLAHVVLPGASFLEKDGTFTSGERRIQRVRRALDPPGEARADWEILLDLMAATGCREAFRHPSEVMEEIAGIAPAFAGVTYDRLDGAGLQWPVPSGDHPGTPTLHRESFPRGRGKLSRVVYVPSPGLGDGLILTTGRVLEHYNAGTMTRRTANLLLVGSDPLEIHPLDAEARGIADGDSVVVESTRGKAHAVAKVTERVPRGVVFLSFHFPETRTNAVTGGILDRVSACPEYKVTAVEVRRAERHRKDSGRKQ